MKTLFIAALLLCSTTLFAQDPALPQTETAKEDEKLFSTVEDMPEFPGGQDSLLSFLMRNCKYPIDTQNNKAEGKVYISFVVSKTGDIRDTKIIRSPSKELGDETLRVFSIMPKWKPGYHNGNAVNIQFMIPINYQLN